MIKRRGLYVACAGIALFGASLWMADSVAASAYAGPAGLDAAAVLDDIFDYAAAGIIVMPGSAERVSFEAESDGVPIMWAVRITDYEPGDSILVAAYGPAGEYGRFVQTGEIGFESEERAAAGVVDIEVTNTGPEPVTTTVMFSAVPEDSEIFANPDSLLNTLIIPLAVAGVALVAGLVVAVAGMVVFVVDASRQRQT